MEKPQSERVRECLNIMKKLTESLELPSDSDELVALRSHMNTYIKTGEAWSGTVDFSRWGRTAHCVFPKQANKQVVVTLKSNKKVSSTV